MSIEVGLRNMLINDAGVSALINQRIWAGLAPLNPTYPVVVFTVASTVDLYSAQGASGYRTKRMQFDSYAPKYNDALAVSEAIRAALQSFTGTVNDGNTDIPVLSVITIADMDFPFEPGSADRIFRRMLEFEVTYTE
jgi:hypothetical protein